MACDAVGTVAPLATARGGSRARGGEWLEKASVPQDPAADARDSAGDTHAQGVLERLVRYITCLGHMLQSPGQRGRRVDPEYWPRDSFAPPPHIEAWGADCPRC